MANKINKTTTGRSPALGVKMASPAAIMVATAKAAMLGKEVDEEDLKAVIAGLRSELDTERRTVRQLRRERDAEVLKVRNEEQTKMSIALKDQSKKLLEEKQREVELQRDVMKSKYESDQSKIVKLKDREITKLRGDLARCQDELKEELSKRGLSTSARASFDTERQKLLQEVRDLQLAKRQLEERLTEAGETEKRLQQEIRRLQESCKLEVARVEREANLEVKKLLEELKAKDHMLEQMDRSIYPDRATILKNRLDKLSIEEMLNLNTIRWSQNNSCRYSTSMSYISRESNITGEQSDDKMSCVLDSDISNATGDSSCKCSRSEKSKSGDALCSCNEEKSCNVDNEVAGLNRCSNSSRSYCTRSSSCSSTSVPNDSVGSKIGSKKRSRSASALGRSPKTGALQGSSKTKNIYNTSNNNETANNNGNGVARPASATPLISSASSVPSRTDHCVTSGGCALQTLNLQKKLYEMERRVKLAEGLNRAVVEKNNTLSSSGKQLENKIKSLSQHINNMKIEHDANQKEIRRLNDVIVGMKGKCDGITDGDLSLELEYCRQRCAELEQVLVSLRRDCLDKDHRIGLLVKSQQKPRHKHEPKTVRFMLPDDTDEKTSDISEEDLNTDTSSSCSDPVQSEELLIQSVHKDYEVLMEEHLKLQKYCATLIQSQSTNNISVNQELHVKRESLDIAVQVMEEKLRMAEEREQKLKQQLQEVYDQNEELEFRVLELEEFADKNKSAPSIDDDNHLSRRNQELEMEVERLHHRLAQYEHLDIIELEKDAHLPCNPLEVTSCTGDHQRLSVENLRKLTVSLSDSDEENQMVQSFSTMTSGFDEISCISLELDDRTEMPDMPGEEEADLEREADDIGPEMPTEECDDILEISDCKFEHSTENVLALLQTVVDEPILSDNIVNRTSCQSANALLVATEKQYFTEQNSPAQQNTEICNEERNMNECVENDMSMKEIIESKSQRILDLKDQVDILEHVDSTYSKTIDTLNQIEQQLQIIIPSELSEIEPLVDDESSTNNNVETFWPTTSKEIANNISIMEGEVITLIPQEHDSIAVTKAKIESHNSVSHSINALHDFIAVVQKENASCTELEKRIEFLQQEQLHSEEKLNKLFQSCESCTKDEAFHPLTFPLVKQNDSSILGSLKRLAFDVVTAGFRTEFLELRALTHEFFSAADEDELNDIAFIDEDDAACVQSDASTPAEKDMPSKLQQRTELRLNTKMSSLNQRFDFLSPTSFDNPDWNGASHLETVNQCLLLQMEELEKERDSLKDIVCRDDAVINEMTQKISLLENSEHELKKIVDRLEEADELAGEHICRLEADCQRLRAKLSRAESIESSLRAEMDAQGKREAEMEAKLLRSVESLEHTTNKLRCSLNEVEKEKESAIKQAEDLNTFIVSLKQKETYMLQRIKLCEGLNKSLKEKTNELETSLSLAYDEVAGLTGQKDSLIQRLNSVTVENKDLVRENEELTSDKKNLVADIESLTESENFLREANRKMWLSLKANIEEMEKVEDKSCKYCSRRFQDNERPENKSNVTSPVDKILEENSTQTDRCGVSSIRTKESPIYCGLQQILYQLSQKDHTTTLLILNLIIDLLCCYSHQRTAGFLLSRGSLESEKKARVEEMLKFVASTRLRGSANSLKSATSSAAEKRTSNGGGFGEDVSELDPVDEEEEFWSVVENYEDIYDVRAADTWNLWRHLEQDIMGLNLDQLRKLLQEREAEKSCQTSLSELRQATSTSILEQSTQCDSEGEHGALTVPPLPTSLPPRDESQMEQSTQTEMVEPTAASQVEPTDDSSALRHLLNHNERTISAQKNEVDRLTVEMRSWQQRALEAGDQVSRLTTELSKARQQIESTKYRPISEMKTPTSSTTDSKFQPAVSPSDRRSRIELSSSQIPVSVKRAVDFYSSISERSGSTSSSSSQTSLRSRTTSTSPGPARASPSLRTASTSPGPVQTSSTYRTTLVSPGQTPTGSRTISFIPRYVTEKANGQHATAATATTQGPLSNGSSSSEHQQQELPASQIPRLLPEWIQQQQQQLQQLRDQQLCGTDNVEKNAPEDEGESVAGSSPRLQQLPAAADIPATAESSHNAAAASETQTEVSLLSDGVIDASANEREF